MAIEQRKALDIAPLEGTQKKKPEALPPHQRFGVGRRFRFGTTTIDVFPDPPGELNPVVSIRLRRGSLLIGDVQAIAPVDGGMQLLHADGGIDISKNGDLAMVYVAPRPEPEREYVEKEDKTIILRDARGTEHTQDMLPGAEKAEKQKYLRIELIVGSKPIGVTRKRGAPVRLTAYQKFDPEDTTKEKQWEVKAYGEYVAKVKDLQPGWKIFGIFAHKQWKSPKAGGGFIEDECLNVAGPITVLDKKDGRTPKRSRHTQQAEG